MARALVQSLPVEIAILGIFELFISFALIFGMLVANGSSPLPDSGNLTRDCLVLSGMLAVTIGGTAATIGFYRPDVYLDRRRLLLSGTITAIFAFPAILAVSGVYHMTLSGDHVAWLARVMVMWLAFILVLRFGVGAIAARRPISRRVLIIGSNPRAAGLRQRLAAARNVLFDPVGGTQETGTQETGTQETGTQETGTQETGTQEMGRQATGGTMTGDRIWGIVVAGGAPIAEECDRLLDRKLRGVPVYNDVTFQEHHLGRIELDAIDANWMLFAEGFQTGMVSRGVKRIFDVAVSVGLLVATLPLMLVTAVAIRLDSPGPVFYRQVRTGLHGEPLTLIKFRSMTADAEIAGKPQWAQKSDPRATRVGAFIRTTRIDELPQLINVLRGEMSMIGPRPERPMFVESLAKVIPFYNCREYVKPGLTGWAQVNYPYGASVEDAREKLAYDLYYVKNRGIVLDLIILFSTVRVILFRVGAR